MRLPNRLVAIVRTTVLTLLAIVSLLTFPSAIPWMIAFWLSWQTLLIFRNRPAWPPLATCLVILMVKRVDWSPAFMVTSVLMLALCLLGAYIRRIPPRWPRRLLWLGTAALWIAWAGLAYQSQRSARAGGVLRIQPLRPVACIGDSLTKFGYPACLRDLVSLPVADLSCSGITSEQALTIIPALLRANPQVVVIELGGHDYLKGHSRSATRENLEKLVAASRSIGAEVVMMEIPRGFITDPFGSLEREMARQDCLELIPDTAIRRLVLWSPAAPPGMWLKPERRLSDDGLHPNSRGNQMLAEYVAEALRRMYGPAVLKSRGEDTSLNAK